MRWISIGMVRDDSNTRSSGAGSLSPATANAEPSTAVEREITRAVMEALGRFGISGQVRLARGQLVLHLPQGVTSTTLGPTAHLWESWGEAERRTRATEWARELARARSRLTAGRARSSGRLVSWLGGLLILGLAGGGYHYWSTRVAAPSLPPRQASRALEAAVVPTVERDRASRVCEATRSRVLRGATVSPTDVEGWVVELLGFRKDGSEPVHTSKKLTDFVLEPNAAEGSLFVWKEEPELTRLLTSDTRVVITPEEIRGGQGAVHPGLRVSFRGALVDAYFDPERRARYYHVASGLSEALELTHAGLYARCEDGATHHLGSWFRGATDAEAMTSLLYVLGTYAEPPHIAPQFTRGADGSSFDRSVAFSRVEAAAEALSRPLLSSLLGAHGGMIMGKPGQGVVVHFPFQDGNRASRASREVMRAVGLGND